MATLTGNTIGNIKVAGINRWYIQLPGASAWAEIPFLRNGKLEAKSISTKDSKGRNFAYAVELTASAETIATSDQTNFIEALGDTIGKEVDSMLVLADARVLDTSLVYAGTDGSDAGASFSWKYVCDGDRDETVFVEVTAKRTLLLTEFTTALGGTDASASLSSASASAAGNGLTEWSQAIGDIAPAGINAIAKDTTSDGSGYEEILGITRGGKFTAETLNVRDSYGREMPYAIKVNFEVEMLQATDTEVDFLDNMAIVSADWKITFASGRVATLDDDLGMDYTITNGSDREDVQTIMVTGEGIITGSDWGTPANIWT